MSKKISMSTKTALQLYSNNPNLPGSFSQVFGKHLVAMDNYSNQPHKALYKYNFPVAHRNIQQTVHGGALASIIDISTTISILRMTPLRTISISLNTQFLRVIKVLNEVQIQTEIVKMGKNVVFSQCRIFENVKNQRKLCCKGTHIKSVQRQNWDFVKQWVEENQKISQSKL